MSLVSECCRKVALGDRTQPNSSFLITFGPFAVLLRTLSSLSDLSPRLSWMQFTWKSLTQSQIIFVSPLGTFSLFHLLVEECRRAQVQYR